MPVFIQLKQETVKTEEDFTCLMHSKRFTPIPLLKIMISIIKTDTKRYFFNI